MVYDPDAREMINLKQEQTKIFDETGYFKTVFLSKIWREASIKKLLIRFTCTQPNTV